MAAEKGKEEIQLGAMMPSILYYGADSYLSYKLEPEGDETIKYKDLILVLEKAGKKPTYRPFAVK